MNGDEMPEEVDMRGGERGQYHEAVTPESCIRMLREFDRVVIRRHKHCWHIGWV